MKKQIFILVLLVLAVFANVNKSYGQCNPSSLTPAVGVDYPYGVTVTGASNSSTYSWFVTKNTNLLDGESAPLAATDGFFTVESGSTTNTLHLKWTANAIAQTFYVVVKYTASTLASNGCTVENMKVFEVKPINTFLLAITSSTASGANGQVATCAADITGATVNASASTVQYTYGQNTIYYKVTASGILGAWKPSVRIPALMNDQTYVSAHWSSDNGANWTAISGLATDGSTQDLTLSDATVTNVAGTSYLIRVVINNNNYETLSDQTLTVSVDGLLPTAYTTSDIIGSGSTPCATEAEFGKHADFTISARPTVVVGTLTGSGDLISKNPDPSNP